MARPSLHTATDVLSFQELEDPDGGPPRRFSVVGAQFEPLGYDELLALDGPATFNLRFHSGRILETDIPGVNVGGVASGNAIVQSPFASRAIGLVNGGWLPSSLASHSDTLVMPDRCVVSDLRGRFSAGQRNANPEPDFIDLFAESEIRINPFLFALEGNTKRTPTPHEIEQQWREAHAQLTACLPKAKVLDLNPVLLAGTIGILQSSQADFQLEQRFLSQVAPGLVSPVAHARRFDKSNHIIAIANNLGVKRSSLALVAALSTVFVPNGASPAKRLLKIRPTYSAGDAYNALADLRSLGILMHLFAMYPHDRAMLCTRDKDLALFWVGLNAARFRVVGRHMSFDVTPEPLFPGLDRPQLREVLGLT